MKPEGLDSRSFSIATSGVQHSNPVQHSFCCKLMLQLLWLLQCPISANCIVLDRSQQILHVDNGKKKGVWLYMCTLHKSLDRSQQILHVDDRKRGCSCACAFLLFPPPLTHTHTHMLVCSIFLVTMTVSRVVKTMPRIKTEHLENTKQL